MFGDEYSVVKTVDVVDERIVVEFPHVALTIPFPAAIPKTQLCMINFFSFLYQLRLLKVIIIPYLQFVVLQSIIIT